MVIFSKFISNKKKLERERGKKKRRKRRKAEWKKEREILYSLFIGIKHLVLMLKNIQNPKFMQQIK